MRRFFGLLDEVAVWLFTHRLQSREAHMKMLGANADAISAWNKVAGQPGSAYVEFSWLPANTPEWLRKEIGEKTEIQWLQDRSEQAVSWLRYQKENEDA